MAFEPIYEVAALDCKKKICSSQIVVETRLIPPANVGISKILAITSDVTATTTEVFSQEARVSGRVNFKLLYLSQDNENKNLDCNVDFSDRINDENIQSGKPIIKAKILDAKVIDFSADEVKLSAVVEIELYDQRATRTKYLTKGNDNIYTHEHKVEYTSLVATIDDMFSVETEEDIMCEQILTYDTAVCVKNFETQMDEIKIAGEFILRAVVVASDGIKSIEIYCPFINESRADGVRSDNIVDCCVNIVSTEIEITQGKLKVCYKGNVRGYVYAQQSMNAVCDAFSVANELNKQLSNINYDVAKGCFSIVDDVDGSITLDNNMPIADNILAAAGTNIHLANVYAQDGKIVAEGMVSTNLVYYSSEANAVNSVKAEIPFVLEKNAPISENNEVFAEGYITRISHRVRRGNELSVKAEICLIVSVCEHRSVEIITSLVEGEEIPVPTSAISLHIARPNESLWEVAKALSTTPELVLVQNPNLSLPLMGGERIVAYRHLKKSNS